jgi:putative lipoprotein
MRRGSHIAAPVVALLLLASTALAETMHLDTTVTYRERIALPPNAILEVELLDTSRADAPSVRLSLQRFRLTGVPRTVEIAYDTDLIDERFTYTVAAKIISEGRVIFRSTMATPVLTRGAPNSAELVLELMARQTDGEEVDKSIHGAIWAVFEIAGQIVVAEDPPTLALDQRGQFSLYSGCNRFSGNLDAGNGSFRMPENFAGTMMACPEDREHLERGTLEALKAATGYVRNGSNLTLTNEAGVPILRLREILN